MCWFRKKKRYKRTIIHYLIGLGEANCKLGPGDHTGASYAFDIYDWANGIYHYEV